MALPSNEVQIRNYIASITAGKFLQDYTKLSDENRALSIVIARNKGYIGSNGTDLSKIPPFMFYQVVDEAINATKGRKLEEIYDSYNKTNTATGVSNADLFNTEIQKRTLKGKYNYTVTAPNPLTPLSQAKAQLTTPENINKYIDLLNEVYNTVKTNAAFIA
jgi:hypothetical protein